MINKNKLTTFLDTYEKTRKILPELGLVTNGNNRYLFIGGEKLLDVTSNKELSISTLFMNGIILGYTKSKSK